MRIFSSTMLLLLVGNALGAPQRQSKELIDRNNKVITEYNKEQAGTKDYFTLFVIQPTHGYRSLSACVDDLIKQGTLPKEYTVTPKQHWHISVMAFAVPFEGKANKKEVEQARDTLSSILKKYTPALRGIALTHTSVETIGTNKFLAAHYGFKTPQDKATFFDVYRTIVSELVTYYPAWMVYGYRFIPHISVAKTTAQGSLPYKKVNTSTCPCPIADVQLMHAGRDLKVSAGYKDPATGKVVYL